MPGQLTRFRIEGLHNNRTIDIPIIDNKLVLVGENGTGKSTVANFIYFFLTTQWSRMIEHKFKSVLAVIDSKAYEFGRDNIISLARQSDFMRNRFRLPISILREIEAFVGEHAPEEVIDPRRISQELGVPLHIISREIERITFENLVPGELKENIQSLRSSITDQVLYLPTYRRIEQDLETIFPELEKKLREPREHLPRRARDTGYIELVEFGMEDVENTIHRKMIEIKETVRKDLSTLTGAYLRDVIQGAYQSVDPSKFRELDETRIDDIFKRIPEEILPGKDKTSLQSIISEINKSGEISDDNKVVAHFLTKLVELYQKQQDDERDIREFVRICNEGYLSGKKFVYDDVSFEVFINQHIEDSDSPKLPLRALSSGEKQIVSLFSHLYLSGKSGFFVVIDEPELSLSVPWQKRFLPDILTRCNGLIAVTHSPFIFENELQPYTHSLEEFIESYEYDPNLEDDEIITAKEIMF
jgi:predicted ATPase